MAQQKSKSDNSFRFKSFAERVQEIDLRRQAFYHIGHENEELPEDDETYFHQTLKKWQVLNLSEEFVKFSRKCMKIVTLPQLMHQKQFVLDLLLQHLSTASNLSLQPLLELLSVLARDLREEFYAHFQVILERLICLLNSEDAEQLEWTLVCLAQLFKTLKPYLKKNIGLIFNAILPLLSEQCYAEHINNFAVECFAFIARDIKDYERFLQFILQTLQQQEYAEESVQACGRLFFEMLRGVQGMFHAIAADFMKCLFEGMLQKDDEQQQELLCSIVSQMLKHVLQFVRVEYIALFWQQLCDVIERNLQHEKLLNLLTLFLQASEYGKLGTAGCQLTQMDLLVNTLLKAQKSLYAVECAIEEEQRLLNLQMLCQIVSSILLLANNKQLTQLQSSRLLKQMLGMQESRAIYEQFVRSIKDLPQFEMSVLPNVIGYFESNFDKQALELLAHVVLHKRAMSGNAWELKHWQPYALHLKSAECLQQIVQKLQQEPTIADEEQLLLWLLAAHIVALNRQQLQEPLLKMLELLLQQLQLKEQPKIICLLCMLLELQCQMQLKLNKKLLKACAHALLPYIAHNLRALRALNLLLAQGPIDVVEDYAAQLSCLLASHCHDVRLNAAYAMHLLYKTHVQPNPYKIIYEAESIIPTVHNYREQLLLLQKLHTGSECFKSQQYQLHQQNVLRFLLGLLYHNFKLLWEPVLKLIEQYAAIMNVQEFWTIYKAQMQQTAHEIQANYEQQQQQNNKQLEILWQSNTLSQHFAMTHLPTLTQQQLYNYRNLLWQRLAQYGAMLELKNHDIVGMFLSFLQQEYYKHLEQGDYSWNLLAGKAIDDDDKPTASKSIHLKSILQTLCCKLAIFQTLDNPKALHREPELQQLYMQLLAGSNAQLQKLSLNCLLAYKSKVLLAHKSQLLALIDERQFKQALLQIDLSKLSTTDRQTLMPILLRLLYGKMITKGTQRSVGSQLRKGLIMRFLAQCSAQEIFDFLQMAFGKYQQYSSMDMQLQHIPDAVAKDFQPSSVWSARKLQNIVNLLELIRKEFVALLAEEFQIYMLKLLLFVGSTCNQVLQLKDVMPMHAKMPLVYRNVRQSALQSLLNFFQHLQQFPWQNTQITVITQVFIWPSIESLPQDSIHAPNLLLKLLLQWSEQPQHFQFLQQTVPTTKQPIFYYIMQLLLNDKAKPAVRKCIMCMLERLLVATEEADIPATLMPVSGLQLLQPYIPQILQRLKLNFSTLKAKRMLDKRDLHILSLLTKHVQQPDTCDALLQLLLPVLVSKTQTSAAEEVVCQILQTLSNLLKRLPAPELYLLKLAPLFEQLQQQNARKQLCQLIAEIAKKRQQEQQLYTQLKQTARLIYMLNAWDKRWLEQPDYDKRLDALKEITQQLHKHEVELELGLLVMYNCCYFLKYDKDMGLRDNASEHLRLLLPNLLQKYATDTPKLKYLLHEIFQLLRRIITDAQDNVRNEGIRLLGILARDCAHTHIIFQDLSALGDAQDVEVDFFENLTHLQTHRHGRALLKFTAHAQSLQQAPNQRTLQMFLLPLATRYLFNEKYANKHTLIDAAIEAVGIICQLLPWPAYHSILRYYLMKMRSTAEYQKQAVRLVVRILDAFHFDLTLAQTDEQELARLKEQLMAEEASELKKASTEKSKKTTKEKSKKVNDDDGEIVVENAKENDENADENAAENDDDNDDESADESEDENDDEADLLSIADDEAEDMNAANIKPTLEPILKTTQSLSAQASKRVIITITTILLPSLNRCITEKSSYDNKHKVNRKRFSIEREEEETMRVPIALAMVKLMQKLPKKLMDSSLPGVIIKVCSFLRSPLKSVRMLTRDILKKIILTLGSSYLAMLVNHLQSLLTRGFQVHVLSVTVHGVLDALKFDLQAGDIDSCLSNLLEVALNDIFGEINAEKEVAKIGAHTPEAKPSAKSYLILHLAARNIQESCLLDFLLPFKEHLARSQSRKITLKIQECFGKIVSGLVQNKHVTCESLLIFIYGIMSESIADLLPGIQKRVLSEQEKEKMRRARADCYLIQPAPKRAGALNKRAKSNAQANAHILIEFGLEMLSSVLKRKKLLELDYQPFLQPLLPLLKDALKSTHARVSTFALQCFCAIWNDDYELPALSTLMLEIVQSIFDILKNYASFGASRQEDNMQLLKALFKALVSILRKCADYEFTDVQLEQMLLFVQQDLLECEHTAMSFALLKAMLTRQIDTPAMHDIMKEIADLCIQSPSDYMRDESRALMLLYVMEYTLKKRVDHILKFFSAQLCYVLPSGRLSAIKFLHALVQKFPLQVLAYRAEFLYLSLGTRLVNDEDTVCRKAVAECIKLLITRLDKVNRQRLFDMTLLFFHDTNKPAVREMAACLCARFLNAEKKSFAPRLKLCLPVLVQRMTGQSAANAAGRFVRAPNAEQQQHKRAKLANDANEEANEQLKQRALDHELIQMQFCLLKLFDHCADELLANDELNYCLDELAYESQKMLAHEHQWVRCNAAKILCCILANYDFALVGARLLTGSSENAEVDKQLQFIYAQPAHDIKSLVLDLCAQLIPGDTSEVMIAEIVKIFLFIANMLQEQPLKLKKQPDDVLPKINLYWLIRNISLMINKEVAKAPHSTVIRTAFFQLIEGIITLLSVDTLEQLGMSLLAVLVREMSEEDQNVDADLRQLALRVGSRLRKRIGSDVYDKMRTQIMQKLMIRRAERKKTLAQEKVHDPVRAAKRKVAVRERKKVNKKLKTAIMRGKAADTKQKLKKRKRKAEEDIF